MEVVKNFRFEARELLASVFRESEARPVKNRDACMKKKCVYLGILSFPKRKSNFSFLWPEDRQKI